MWKQPHPNPGPDSRQFFPRAVSTIAITLLMLAGAGTASVAREKIPYFIGLNACLKWCDEHNSASSDTQACENQCAQYWACNALDATQFDCRRRGGTLDAGINPAANGAGAPAGNPPSTSTPPTPAQ
jgi:hypothetical protein